MEQVFEIIRWVIANGEPLMAIVGTLVVAASGIVALTSTPRDDEVVGTIRTTLERFSFMRSEEGRGQKKLVDDEDWG